MKTLSPIYLASLYLVLACLFWAGNFIVGKAASIIDIPPISLNFYRWFLAWIVLLPFTYRELLSNKKIILSAIDNMIKGGAGQAVQNRNNKFNFSVTTGLK